MICGPPRFRLAWLSHPAGRKIQSTGWRYFVTFEGFTDKTGEQSYNDALQQTLGNLEHFFCTFRFCRSQPPSSSC